MTKSFDKKNHQKDGITSVVVIKDFKGKRMNKKTGCYFENIEKLLKILVSRVIKDLCMTAVLKFFQKYSIYAKEIYMLISFHLFFIEPAWVS